MKWQQYPFLWLLLGIVTGILGYEWLGNLWYTNAGFVILVLVTSGFLVLNLTSFALLWLMRLRSPLMLIVVAFWSYWNCAWQDVRNADDWYGHELTTANYFVGVIASPISEKAQTFQFDVQLQMALVDSLGKNVRGQLPIYVFKKDYPGHLKEGDVVLIANQLSPILPTNNPFAFEYSQYLARKGIFHQAFIANKDIRLLHSGASSGSFFRRWKAKMNHILQRNVADPTTLSLMQATMLNERALLNDDIWKTYSQTGIVHIISISGMHVSIMLGVFMLLFYGIKNKRHQWIKYVCALPLVWAYILLTDSPASAVRAGMMFTILAFSIFLTKRQNAINTWAAAAFLMLVFQPNWFFDIGMQLSFVCILSIILFYQPIYKMWFVRNRVGRYIWQGLAVSLAVQILAAPIVVYYFHQFPVWVFVANIPAALFSTALMIGTIVILVFGALGIPMHWLGDLLALYTRFFNAFIARLSAWTPDFFSRFQVDVLDAFLLMLFLWFSFLCIKYRRKIYALGWTVVTLLGVISWSAQYIRQGQQEVFVVYASNKKSLIGYVKGHDYYLSTIDTLSEKEYQQIVLPSQTGFGLSSAKEALPINAIFQVKDKRCLVLNSNQLQAQKVDVLVLSSGQDWDEVYIQSFQPKWVVLDSSFPRWKSIQLKNRLEQNNLNVHNVVTQGAFVWNVASNLIP